MKKITSGLVSFVIIICFSVVTSVALVQTDCFAKKSDDKSKISSKKMNKVEKAEKKNQKKMEKKQSKKQKKQNKIKGLEKKIERLNVIATKLEADGKTEQAAELKVKIAKAQKKLDAKKQTVEKMDSEEKEEVEVEKE